jgi:hypothetical protein
MNYLKKYLLSSIFVLTAIFIHPAAPARHTADDYSAEIEQILPKANKLSDDLTVMAMIDLKKIDPILVKKTMDELKATSVSLNQELDKIGENPHARRSGIFKLAKSLLDIIGHRIQDCAQSIESTDKEKDKEKNDPTSIKIITIMMHAQMLMNKIELDKATEETLKEQTLFLNIQNEELNKIGKDPRARKRSDFKLTKKLIDFIGQAMQYQLSIIKPSRPMLAPQKKLPDPRTALSPEQLAKVQKAQAELIAEEEQPGTKQRRERENRRKQEQTQLLQAQAQYQLELLKKQKEEKEQAQHKTDAQEHAQLQFDFMQQKEDQERAQVEEHALFDFKFLEGREALEKDAQGEFQWLLEQKEAEERAQWAQGVLDEFLPPLALTEAQK